MPAKITSIIPKSPAAKTRIAPGDLLVSLNGHEINDVLDYRFYAAESRLLLSLLRPGGGAYAVRLRKGEYDDIGLEFADGLMDGQRRCRNRCVFCFIDQLPQGLRESLYFKDDDARLGFLFGNYITLTNLTDREARRIVEMRLSPVNVSVHTMDPALRCRLMGNPQAGESLRFLEQFARAGLDLNIQLVLCPGWNDGEALRHSLRELQKLPTIRSVAAVPVGLTKYRDHLAQLRPFSKEEAAAVVDTFDEFRQARHADCLAGESGAELCASDEFFLLAGRPMPGPDYYGEYRQLENGVGLWASLKADMESIFLCEDMLTEPPAPCSLATGEAAAPLLQLFVDEWRKIWHNSNIQVHCVRNDFFGEHITVAGLLTGRDVIAQLRGKNLGETLFLPAVCLNADGLTLDGLTLQEISQALGVPVKAVKNDAEAMVAQIIGGTP
ncbi:MAG: DUF512 domain-containing protein [Oscillospiraceae bacterium]|jgi:putative radical SAM enzyme (TIGR03279 family)|nr:DUF512 domain-containing protein [Oscillospiraceae bacterium]